MKLIALLAIAALAGCKPTADTPMTKGSQAVEKGQRFDVSRVGVIEDDLAYSDRRGIYIIKDKQTGVEYVGVSGIGISEVGSHTVKSGKNTTTKQDER